MSINLLITGADGFIGKNLISYIKNNSKDIVLKTYTKKNNFKQLKEAIFWSEIIIHLAGENRSDNRENFYKNNIDLSKKIADLVIEKLNLTKKFTKIVFSSTIQVGGDSVYSISKRKAEEYFLNLKKIYKMPIHIIRIMNVFGKWCKPNYNSVVATFCYKLIHNQEINIIDGRKKLNLIYIDDLVKIILEIILDTKNQKYKISDNVDLSPTYDIEVQELATLLRQFHENRKLKKIDNLGKGFFKALYSTYISYLKPENFSYKLDINSDERGIFVEMLKSEESGQISFFTANPGVTRGGHFHNTKTEKFLVVSGKALFRFRNVLNGSSFSIETSSGSPEVVDTIPGWSHDITNIGDEVMIVLLWANELFDKNNPDTYPDKTLNNLE